MLFRVYCWLSVLLISACDHLVRKNDDSRPRAELLILGTMQDGGAPHAGCSKNCCKDLWEKPNPDLKVVSMGLVDMSDSAAFMLEATPDFPEQLQQLEETYQLELSGILLTHAHIGHYAGLMHLGREVMGAKRIPVYAMPLMDSFLSNNGPWSQLIDIENIVIRSIDQGKKYSISKHLSVMPLRVPHRDEFSETVGYSIEGPNKSVLFIPDIDKWHQWDLKLVEMIVKHDFVFIDATFYDASELPGRELSEIPHPTVLETMDLISHLSKEVKSKVYFIHTNHTNPLVREGSDESKIVHSNGFHIARRGMRFVL